MILSIHVPKAAGNSFRVLLQNEFGARMMKDYGDWAGCRVPEAMERCQSRTLAMRNRRNELLQKYDVIHGHFAPDKYSGLFPIEDFVAFFRDPYQQVVSHYYFLQRNPQRDHPEERIFHEAKMTLHDYVSWEAFHDHQTQYLGSLSIDDLAMVGLSEEFYRSVEVFNSMFGCDLQGNSFLNVNPDTQGDAYRISPDIRKAVKKYRAADIDTYERAKEIFKRQASKVLQYSAHGATSLLPLKAPRPSSVS
jgi:hypothetical protein